MSDQKPDALWLMLGEIRGDLKWLVEERRSASRRMDAIETEIKDSVAEHSKRLGKLEAFKIRIGVLTGALGVLVPSFASVILHKLGLI